MSVRSGLIVVTVLSTAIAGALRAQAPAPQPGAAAGTVLRGAVVRSDTGAPAPGSWVGIAGETSSGELVLGSRFGGIVTDAQGRFVFENVRPGRYSVYAGWTDGSVACCPLLGRRIEIRAGVEPDSLTLRIVPKSSISGTVRGPDGLPLQGVQVAAAVLWQQDGRPTLRRDASSQTDEHGRYQLGVTPGYEYYLRVDPRVRDAPEASDDWPRTYYPSATSLAGAEPIAVVPGAAVTERDVHVRAVRTFRISGTLDTQLSRTTSVTFRLVPAGNTITDGPLVAPATWSSPDAFEVLRVPPGTYDLYALAPRQADTSYGPFHAGRARVTVADRDVGGVRLTVRPGVDVRVRDVSEPSRASTTVRGPDDFAGLDRQRRVWLTPRHSLWEHPFYDDREHRGGPDVPADADGVFTLRGVAEGTYDVKINVNGADDFGRPRPRYPIPAGEYLADIRQNGRSVLEEGIEVGASASAPIDLVFRPGAATIVGTVKSRSAMSEQVVLLPRASGRWRTLHYRMTGLDSSGAFQLTNVAPGEYLIFASDTPRLPFGERHWLKESEATIQRLSTMARAISVAEGDRLDVSLESRDMTPAIVIRQAVPLNAQ